jgi:predicted CXXCH cytochrome family protein
VKRIALLVAGSAVVLVAGAGPALADNGPHVKTSVAAGATATTWGGVTKCASCHRAHTGQAAFLLVQDQEALCFTCHGGTSSGTNVQNGQDGNGGALRGGGFDTSAISADNPTALYYFNAARGSVSLQTGTIPALNVAVPTTSKHGLGATGAWGYGLSGAASGTLGSPLECGSCHDPHGNGNYRILNTVPGGVTNAALAVTQASLTTNVATITTASEHYLGVGNLVTLAGFAAPNTALNGTFTIIATSTYTSYQIAVTNADIAAYAPTGVTSKNAGSTIADATTKTYTTTDYWKVNDESTPVQSWGAGTALKTNVNSFIANIAGWCTQCHTRYQTGRSQTYSQPSNDPVFTYRHRGNSVANNSANNPVNGVTYPNQVNAANCIQCHVAHGSNANVAGAAARVNWPGTTGSGTPAGSNYEKSSLLRISNRGVCQMCHNK